jgi:hypothetical protein
MNARTSFRISCGAAGNVEGPGWSSLPCLSLLHGWWSQPNMCCLRYDFPFELCQMSRLLKRKKWTCMLKRL